MKYSIFYSWQSDLSEIHNLIYEALKGACKTLGHEGIDYQICQDDRNSKGSENISVNILSSIGNAHVFLGDLSPVWEYEGKEGKKLMPNSNVMFEYGYAIRALGEVKCKQIICLRQGQTFNQLPFDICQRDAIRITLDDRNHLQHILENWLRNKALNPLQESTIKFSDNKAEITLHPEFIQTRYIESKPGTSFLSKLGGIKDSSLETLETLKTSPKSLFKNISITKLKKEVIDPIASTVNPIGINTTCLPINFFIENTGKEPLDEIDIDITIPDITIPIDSEASFKGTNKNNPLSIFSDDSSRLVSDISADGKSIKKNISTLNPGAKKPVTQCYISLPHTKTDIVLTWEIISRTFRKSGTLTIHCEPTFLQREVENSEKAGQVEITEGIEKTFFNED